MSTALPPAPPRTVSRPRFQSRPGVPGPPLATYTPPPPNRPPAQLRFPRTPGVPATRTPPAPPPPVATPAPPPTTIRTPAPARGGTPGTPTLNQSGFRTPDALSRPRYVKPPRNWKPTARAPVVVPTAVVPTTVVPTTVPTALVPTTVPTAVVPTTSLVNPLAPPNSAPAPDDLESSDSTLLVVGVVAVLLVAWFFWR